MKDLLEKCCGVDVHKDIIVAYILSGPIGRTTVSEIREFSTLASLSIIARIGTDIDSFKTAEHICSWTLPATMRVRANVTIFWLHGIGNSNRRKIPKKPLLHLPASF